MPQITKRVLSQFIGSGCERQLALELYPDNATFRPERQAHGIPGLERGDETVAPCRQLDWRNEPQRGSERRRGTVVMRALQHRVEVPPVRTIMRPVGSAPNKSRD